jgi:D-inositol-3-phosphate glycosyltransferase
LIVSYDYPGPSVFGYETDNLRRVASISVHTSPLASLGGKDAGGMNVYVRELSCHVAARGLPVDIFTRRTSPDTPEVQTICEGVNLVTISAGPPEPLDKNILPALLPEFAEQMALYALRTGVRYDVIHAHYWLSGLTAELMRRYWETPYALMFHTTAHMKNRVSPVAVRESQLRERKERRLIDLADSIIAANPDERADLIWRQHTAPAKICTIPPGVDVALFQPLDRAHCREDLGIAPEEKIVLFVGRIDPIKGIDTLLEAFAMVASEMPDCRLVLVGGDLDSEGNPEGPLRDVRAKGESLGLSRQVRFEGSQPQNLLPVYYNTADVVAVPSRYESFGLVAVEAMACGVPVVASRAGGLIFTIEDGETGCLAPIDRPESHAAAMLALLRDPELRGRMGENAHEAAQRFSWKTVAESVIHVYRRLAAGQRGNLCCEQEIFA